MFREKMINLMLSPYLVIAVLLTACIPTKGNHATVLPASVSSPAEMAETLVADPAYLRDCETISSSPPKLPLDYLGIFPGQSKAEDVETLLGNPKEQWADIFANYVAGNINLVTTQGKDLYDFIKVVLP